MAMDLGQSFPLSKTKSDLDEALTNIGSDHLCDNCLEESKSVDAVVFCKECEDHLCSDCEAAHSKTKLTRSHCVVPFPKVKVIAPLWPASLTSPKLEPMEHGTSTSQGDPDAAVPMPCTIHGQKTAMFCCMTCSEPLCADCMIDILNKTNSLHKDHKVCDLKDAMKSRAQDSEDLMDKIKDSIDKWDEVLQQEDSWKERLHMQESQLGKEIQNRCEQIISAANQWKMIVLQQAEVNQKAQAKKVKAHTKRLKNKQQQLSKLHANLKDMTKRLWSGDASALAELKKLGVAKKLDRYDPLKPEKCELALEEYHLGIHHCVSKETFLCSSNTEHELQLLNHFGKLYNSYEEPLELVRPESTASLVSEPDLAKGPETTQDSV